jgi:hypothetical protein
VISWFRRGDSSPRPPLAGRLAGLAVGVGLLSLASLFALHVLALLLPVVVPLLVLVGIYAAITPHRRRK